MGYNTEYTISIVSHPPNVVPKKVIHHFESSREGVHLTNFTGGVEFGNYDIDQLLCDFSKLYPETVFAITGVCKEEDDVAYWRRYYSDGEMYEVDGRVVYEEFDEFKLSVSKEIILDMDSQHEPEVEHTEPKSEQSIRRIISIYRNESSFSNEYLTTVVQQEIPTDRYHYHASVNKLCCAPLVEVSKNHPDVVFVLNERWFPKNFQAQEGACAENALLYCRTYYKNGSHYQIQGEIPINIFESGIPENIDELVTFEEFDESKLN